jgi:hypothetical protein
MAKETTAQKDPMLTYVKIRLPRPTGSEPKEIVAGINGKLWRIQKGVEVEVPKPIVDLIEDSERRKDQQLAYIEEQQAEERRRKAELGLWR